MNKILRIGIIGLLHVTVYLWLLPFVILPRFGSMGSKITVAVVIGMSLILLFLMFRKKRK